MRSARSRYYGRRVNAVPMPTLPQGRNGVADFIPVARIADMLLNPGGTYRYNGETRTYPDIRLVYWAGGNPFHHHQDLNRLRKAFARLDTLVVHELAWTATARHADIVLPCDHDAGARGYRRHRQRSADGRRCTGLRRAVRRGARRLRDLRRSRRAPRRPRALHRRPQRRGNGWSISTSRRATALAAQGLAGAELRRVLGSAAA